MTLQQNGKHFHHQPIVGKKRHDIRIYNNGSVSIVDRRNPMQVKETVYIRPAKVLTTFNLLAQIVPDKEPFPDGNNYKTELLDVASLEYSVVNYLFTSTGGPQIQSILKL